VFSSQCTGSYLRGHVNIYDLCPKEIIPYIGLFGCKKSECVYIKPPLDSDEFTYVVHV